MNLEADYVVLGGGFYGLYSARTLAEHGARVILLERDKALFSRASYINQARVHFGYHYPRSLYTATKTASYFDRFHKEFGFSIKSDFKKIYAISSVFSFTGPKQFEKFCESARIPCKAVRVDDYFNPQYILGAYETTEYTYDAALLCEHLQAELGKYAKQVQVLTEVELDRVERAADAFVIRCRDGTCIRSARVLNATYASVNQVSDLFDAAAVPIKYELCEIVLCEPNARLRELGITVMDGPFFSLMPFGHTGKHSLTSVTSTPHLTSYSRLPTFACQQTQPRCSPAALDNCNDCANRPRSAWPYMSQLARKYLHRDLAFSYASSLFSMKPVLLAAEIDDARPTVIHKQHEKPLFRSVLSGKINTVYDLRQDLIDDLDS